MIRSLGSVAYSTALLWSKLCIGTSFLQGFPHTLKGLSFRVASFWSSGFGGVNLESLFDAFNSPRLACGSMKKKRCKWMTVTHTVTAGVGHSCRFDCLFLLPRRNNCQLYPSMCTSFLLFYASTVMYLMNFVVHGNCRWTTDVGHDVYNEGINGNRVHTGKLKAMEQSLEHTSCTACARENWP